MRGLPQGVVVKMSRTIEDEAWDIICGGETESVEALLREIKSYRDQLYCECSRAKVGHLSCIQCDHED